MANSFNIGDVIELRHEGLYVPRQTRWNMVTHWWVNSVVDDVATDYDILVNYCQEQWNRYRGTIHNIQVVGWHLQAVRAKRIAPVQSVFAVYSATTVGGEITGTVDEPDDAAVITKRSNKAGRRFLGRAYIGGILDSQIEDGVIAESHAQAIADNVFTFLCQAANTNELETSGIIWSKKHYSLFPTTIAASAAITRVECDRVMRRQTRRDLDVRVPVLGVENP